MQSEHLEQKAEIALSRLMPGSLFFDQPFDA